MGTKLSEYLEREGRATSPESADRRARFTQAYTLAADLIELRLAAGLTQAELSARSGVAQSEISRIERGSVHPTDTTWSRLAAALGAEVRMVARPGSPRPTPTPQPSSRARRPALAGAAPAASRSS